MIADGKHIAHILEEQLAEQLAQQLATLPTQHVCFILFGDNPASRQFIRIKTRVAERLGITVTTLEYPESDSTDDAVSHVRQAITQDIYSGIVIQLPLPKGLDANPILNSIPVELDIDMLCDASEQQYISQHTHMIPPVARAIWNILNFYNINLTNHAVNPKNILIIGNGKLVGRPLSLLFKKNNIPFSLVDEYTDITKKQSLIASADIIISGTGTPHLIKPPMIKDGVVLIDAGTSEQDGKLVGDIDPACSDKATLLTPVPGGVGPVTVISLFMNLLK